MKTTTLYGIVFASILVLGVASILQTPKKQTKEGFEAKEIGVSLTIALSLLLVLFAGFFLYFYFVPKQPNVLRQQMYYNLE